MFNLPLFDIGSDLLSNDHANFIESSINDLIIADCHNDDSIDWYTDGVDDGKWMIINRDSNDEITGIETNM